MFSKTGFHNVQVRWSNGSALTLMLAGRRWQAGPGGSL